MIRLVTARNASTHAVLLDEMYRARKTLFAARLGWDVMVDNAGREMDYYDTLPPHYLIAVDHDGHHRGSLRLLPTTGETLLRDHFASIFDGAMLQSPMIWECTRFCVGDDARDVGEVTRELLLGLCEIGLDKNIVQIGSIFDERTLDICRYAGWAPVVLGKSGRGKKAAFLGMWEVSNKTADTIRKRARIEGPVLA